jgi:hypothetical protein
MLNRGISEKGDEGERKYADENWMIYETNKRKRQ